MPTVSGTNLNDWNTQNFWLFDTVNEIPATALHRWIAISGGTGFTADSYWGSAFNASFSLGGQGVHNILTTKLKDNSAAYTPSAGANGGSWSYVTGRTDGDGTFGSNLCLVPGGFSQGGITGLCYDPDSPAVDEDVMGMTVRISGGFGLTPGDYICASFIPSGSNPFGVSTMQLVQRANFLAAIVYCGSADGANSATWSVVAGQSLRSIKPTPNTTFTGAIKIGLAGDSITHHNDQFVTELAAAFPNASSRTVTETGVDGSTADQWARGQTNYNTAVAAFNSAGVTIVNVQLGTNASASVAAWLAAMQSFVSGIFLDVPTCTKVVVQEIPFFGTTAGDAVVQSYNAQLDNIGNGAIISRGAHSFFAADYTYMNTDAVHPNTPPYGYRAVSRLWLKGGLANAISPAFTFSASPTAIERGVAYSLTLTATGAINLATAVAGDFTLSGCTVTGYNSSTHVLTGVAAASNGARTLTHVPMAATFTITVADTVAPAIPSGISSGTPTGQWALTLSWSADSPSPAGETITYRVFKNGTELTTSPGQSGTTYVLTGVSDGDVFTVKARDNSGNESSVGTYTFVAPSTGGGGSGGTQTFLPAADRLTRTQIIALITQGRSVSIPHPVRGRQLLTKLADVPVDDAALDALYSSDPFLTHRVP